MKKYSVYIVLFLFFFSACNYSVNKKKILGFWEGPHPENPNKNFYVQFSSVEDSIIAKGYWTNHHFYESEFQIEQVAMQKDSIRFYIPGWNCFYSGKLMNDQLIHGGFSCEGEPFDSVTLNKNNQIQKYLTQAKPNCTSVDYEYYYKVPEEIDGKIKTSYFKSVNDSLFIYSLIPEIINNEYGRINSFLLMKNGQLICEEYFYGYTRNDLHQIESSTKSITSLLIGIAKDMGKITNLDEPLYKLFPTYDHLKSNDYKKITLKHLLTMTSGYSAEYEPYRDYDRVDFTLKREISHKTGKEFIYDGGNTELLGAIIKSKTNMFADDFATKYLFEPLGIKNYDWNTFKQKGYPCMGGSLEMLPIDMVKIGMMVLNVGKYDNKQIVSKEWIKESTTSKTKTHIVGDDYAYQWWDITLKSNQHSYKTIWANGWGSQFIYIIPELDVVIVTTGYNYENDSWAITSGISKYLYLLDN